MKTVAVTVRGLDAGFAADGSAEERDLGRLPGDAIVRQLLAIPRELPPAAAAAPPALALVADSGEKMEFRRAESGPLFRLTVTGGETDQPIEELQAAYRVRAFIEHYGEDNELTSEMRLPPEVRAAIKETEASADEQRKKRSASAPPVTSFRKTAPRGPALAVAGAGVLIGASVAFAMGPSRSMQIVSAIPVVVGLAFAVWLMTRVNEILLDRTARVIRERAYGRLDDVCGFDEVKFADTFPSSYVESRVLLHMEDRKVDLGRGVWFNSQAARLAECVNDCILLPEAKRKHLRYRRETKR